MSKHDKKQILAKLLGEVKFAEKQVDKVKLKLAPAEARIKQALKAGNRELAKKYAFDYEEAKLELGRAEQKVLIAKKQYDQGKVQTRELEQAQAMGKLAKSMEAMANSMDVLTQDDDMVRKIEEKVAYSEAKLDIALESAREHHPEIDEPIATHDLPSSEPTAEDILKEFE